MYQYTEHELEIIGGDEKLKKLYKKVLEEKLELDFVNTKLNVKEMKERAKDVDLVDEKDNVEVEQPTF